MDTKKLIKLTRSLAHVAFVILRHAAGFAGLILMHIAKAAAETSSPNEKLVNGFGLIHTNHGIEYGCRGDGPDAQIFTDHR